MIHRLSFIVLVTLLAWSRVASSDAAPEATPPLGVVADPCVGVPTEATAKHKATDDWYGAWMREWLSLDWGQLCRYPAENAALPAAGPHRVVMIGDSITEGWKITVPAFFGDDLLDRGISGQTTAQMLVRFRRDVIELHPAVVHIMGGTNDVASNRGPVSAEFVLGNLASMAELARAHGIRVIVAAIPPCSRLPWIPEIQPAETIRALNVRLEAYAKREGFVWVDYGTVIGDGQGGIRKEFAEDGVHPTAAGYAAMAPLTRAAIERALAQRQP